MSGQLSGLYLQAYGMAYDMARAAERAFQFECGVEETDARFVRPVYWDSRRGGLLAGDALGLDLERMATAYQDAGARGMESRSTSRSALLGICAALQATGRLTAGGIWTAIVLGHITRCALSVGRFRLQRWRGIAVAIPS